LKVFLGGSIRLNALPTQVKQLITEEVSRGSSFAVGDAAGIDLAFQHFLKSQSVKALTVFHSDQLRNNIGNWPTEYVHSDLKSSGKDKFTVKDRKMAELANCGIMVWDGKSAGTLSNVMDLLIQQKPCQLFFAPRADLFLLTTMQELESILTDSEYNSVVDEAKKRLERFRRRATKPANEAVQQPTLPGFD
jgi:hypothetical protein